MVPRNDKVVMRRLFTVVLGVLCAAGPQLHAADVLANVRPNIVLFSPMTSATAT